MLRLRRNQGRMPKDFSQCAGAGAHIGADARGIHAEVAAPLTASGAHVDSAASLVGGDADDNVVGEPKPPALLTGLDAPSVGVGGNDDPSRHRSGDLERLGERLSHRQRSHEGHDVGIGFLLKLRNARIPIIDTPGSFGSHELFEASSDTREARELIRRANEAA